MPEEKKETRPTYIAQNGKVYRFKEKHLKTRFRFPGNSKAYTADSITDVACMERLIKSNSPKIETLKTEKKSSAKLPKAESEKIASVPISK